MSLVRPDVLLRAEAALVLAGGVIAYGHWFPGHWIFFLLLFLFPDVSLFAFLGGNTRAACVLYNVFHTYVLPLVLWPLAWHMQSSMGERLALIWAAHIAVDRLLGYGLKYPGVFKLTHIQRASSV